MPRDRTPLPLVIGQVLPRRLAAAGGVSVCTHKLAQPARLNRRALRKAAGLAPSDLACLPVEGDDRPGRTTPMTSALNSGVNDRRCRRRARAPPPASPFGLPPRGLTPTSELSARWGQVHYIVEVYEDRRVSGHH